MRAEKLLISGAVGAIEIAAQIPDQPRAVAVVAHPHPLFGGTMDNKVATTLARAFAESGAATYRFNFRGVGKSEGVHDEGRGETEDLIAVVTHVMAEFPGLPLWLSGFSFGGAVCLASSEHLPMLSQLVLVAPAFSRLAHWPHASTGGKTPESTLVIHGELDDTVPLVESFAWARERNVPVLVIPGADHFFHQRLHLIRDVTARWVR